MSEAYLIAATHGNVSSLSSHSHAGQVRPILQELFKKSGAPARRVQALHWHGGDQEFWLSSLDSSPRFGELQETMLGFLPEMARYQWPAVPLLVHYALQSTARAIEDEDADLVLLAQETGDQAVALLLASPAVVGIYNLSPRARISRKLALSSAPDGLLKAACIALNKPVRETPVPDADQPNPADVQWLAAAKRLAPAQSPSQDEYFPGARWLLPGKELPPGDLFLLCALVDRLEGEKAQRGLLLSEGPQKSGLVTVVERI